MNGKLAKILRKQAYLNGKAPDTQYSETYNGEQVCLNEKSTYKKLKKAQKELKKSGR